MQELILCRYLKREVPVTALATDVIGTRVNTGPAAGPAFYQYRVTRMAEPFDLLPEHVARLIDATVDGELLVEHLEVICDVLDGGTDSFQWDSDLPEGQRIASVVSWLGTPEINYPLTIPVLKKVREFLLTGNNTLTAADTKR